MLHMFNNNSYTDNIGAAKKFVLIKLCYTNNSAKPKCHKTKLYKTW